IGRRRVLNSGTALSGENQEQLRQRGPVFSRNVCKSNSHPQTGISNSDGTFDLESDSVRFDEKVQFSAGRGGGGHFHVAATETDVAHSNKCTDLAAVGSEFDSALAFVARIISFVSGKRGGGCLFRCCSRS